MQKTLVALSLILATSFAALSDIAFDANTAVSSSTVGYTITGLADTNAGKLVASIGDFDMDGNPDYAVAGVGTTTSTKLWIILGKTSGRSAALTLTGTGTTDFYTITLPASTTVLALAGGDVNGDNSGDVVIGFTDNVWVIYGKGTTAWATTYSDFGSVPTAADVISAKGFAITAPTGKGLGANVAVADVADDSKADVIAGLTGWTGTSTEGALCVVYGKTNTATATTANTNGVRGKDPIDCAALTTTKEGFLVKGVTTDGIGAALASGADYDGDGFNDIFTAGSITANAYIVWGLTRRTTGTEPGTQADIDLATTANRLKIVTPGVAAVTTASFIGNFNGDGNARPELALGHPGYDSAKGRVYVLLGKNTPTTKPSTDITLSSLTATDGITYTGPTASGYFGQVVSGADVNGGGSSDLIVSAPLQNPTARQVATAKGKVYIIFGSASAATQDLGTTALTSTTGVTLTGLGGTGFGESLTAIKDINGDNLADFIVSAPYGTRSGATNTGVVYEFRGQPQPTGSPASGSGFRLHASLLVLASFFVALMF